MNQLNHRGYVQTTDGGGAASVLVNTSEEIGGGLDVGGPAEPAGVSGIEIHGDIGQVQLLEGVDRQLLVCGRRAAALLNVHVGDHVGKRIGLNDEDDADVRVLNDVLADPVNVGLVVGRAAVGDGPLAVRGGSSAVTVREVVDHKLGCLVLAVC